MRPQSPENNDYKLLGSEPGSPATWTHLYGGKNKLRDSGKTIPFPGGGGSLIFNISLLTRGSDLAPTRQRMVSVKLALLIPAKDFWGDDYHVAARLKGCTVSVLRSHCRARLCARSLSRLTLCDPTDCSLPGSSVHGILQARILEWVATSSSRGLPDPREQTCISGTGRRILYRWATWKALQSWADGSWDTPTHPPGPTQWEEPPAGPWSSWEECGLFGTWGQARV